VNRQQLQCLLLPDIGSILPAVFFPRNARRSFRYPPEFRRQRIRLQKERQNNSQPRLYSTPGSTRTGSRLVPLTDSKHHRTVCIRPHTVSRFEFRTTVVFFRPHNGAPAPEGRGAKSRESRATQVALDAVGAIVGDAEDDAHDEAGCKQGPVDDEGVAGTLCLLGGVVQVCAHGRGV
jgi:hypothetical protein